MEQSEIIVDSTVVGGVGTNCFIVRRVDSNRCVVIDPGDDGARISRFIRGNQLILEDILLTHGHFDHIMGIDGFRKEFPEIPVYAHREEEALLKDASMNASLEFGRQYTFSGAAYTEDGDVLDLAGMQFQVIHTPGHTIGGCCYYLQEEKVLFSGDTLFRESIGRTDFPTGNGGQLMRSIREKLFTLPEDTAVYPGHMERTMIGDEKKYNPYF